MGGGDVGTERNRGHLRREVLGDFILCAFALARRHEVFDREWFLRSAHAEISRHTLQASDEALLTLEALFVSAEQSGELARRQMEELLIREAEVVSSGGPEIEPALLVR
jgi:hypothetical protein